MVPFSDRIRCRRSLPLLPHVLTSRFFSDRPSRERTRDERETRYRAGGARDVALVLGGGGAAGNGWVIGVVAGLAEAGIDLTEIADVVIGTSSGAIAAAQLRGGVPLADLYTSVISPLEPRAAPSHQRPPGVPMATLHERMRAISETATSSAEMQKLMGEFGLECDSFLGATEGQHRDVVASRLLSREWPGRPIVVLAVDAHTGEMATFESGADVDLVDAVAAATALPGLSPTIEINGRRYINGGVRSPDNADLASGYATVVVLSPFGGRTGPLPEGQFEGLRRPAAWRMDLDGQVETLKEQGSHVVVITPDAASLAAMGTNQMNPATRVPAARAGFTQGKQHSMSIPS